MYMQFSLYDAYCTLMFPETIAVFQSSSFSKVVNVGHYQHFHCFHHNYYILETLRYPEIGVRVTGSAMFFSFCGDVIDLTR